MSKYICIDIETIGTTNPLAIERIRSREEKKECPGKPTSARPRKETVDKYKKATDEWNKTLEDRVQKKIDCTAKNPLYAELICAAIVTDDGHQCTVSSMEIGEKAALHGILGFINDISNDNTIYTGYYIKHFDLPVLITRARYHDIELPKTFPRKYNKGWSRNVQDIRDYIFSNNPVVSMVEAATAYGVPAKQTTWNGEPMTGARVQEAYRAGEHEMIENYCLSDAIDEFNLFKKVVGTDNNHFLSTKEMIMEILSEDMTPLQKILTIQNLL